MDRAEEAAVLESMDSLLDKNLDDVDDLPEYLDQVPRGLYRLKITKVEHKTVEIKPADSETKIHAPVIQFTYEILEALELADQTMEPPKVGSLINESAFFHKDPDKSMQVLKAKFKEVAASLNIANLRELVGTRTQKAALEGLEIGAFVKTNKDKKKDDTYYIQVSNCKVA